MTREDALKKLVARARIYARLLDYEYDPAGSSYSFEPEPSELQLLSLVAGRAVTEQDLYFIPGPGVSYSISEKLLDEMFPAP